MKKILKHKQIIVFLIALFLFSGISAKLEDGNHPQQLPADSGKTEQVTKKISVKMSLNYFRKANSEETVKVKVWYKEGKKNIPVEHAVVNLYLDSITREGMLTNVITDENGEGTFYLVDRFQKRAEGKYEYTFIGRMMSEDLYEPIEEQITIKKAEIIFTISDDSTMEITAVLQEAGNGNITPVPDVEIKIGTRRTFSILPFGDPQTTDETGSVTVVCPNDIPGDSIGNLTIVAKVEEHEMYGTFEAETIVHWGIPAKIAMQKERTLWASGRNAPIPLVTASIVIVFGIWGVLFYLIIQLFKIKKLSKL